MSERNENSPLTSSLAELSSSLQDREVLIGVTGGIAAFKTAELVSMLAKSGARVTVVMTGSRDAARRSENLEALSGAPSRCQCGSQFHTLPHIELARQAEVFCIAPATANVLAKAATGLGGRPYELHAPGLRRNPSDGARHELGYVEKARNSAQYASTR